ncbi:tetratricopeptide repeat protein [Emticicia sp. CRIBPO]|uniref:tetratricopeptide repeat protein n=1 Tax=Emticicia sp. CRIBPO TaxID=2683258 RepID=UPI0014127597|nr:tetratricopeptide repeat protein [Emticicia sp. CRIBPO]NBA87665.1 tetratricopeptide repeat protein [Emticicia sp. CRIBPO]
MKKITLNLLGTLLISTAGLAQNTLSYTEIESHYNNGVELFEKKAFSASRKEFRNYIEKSERSLNPNKFNIGNAEYYSALSSLYSKSKDADIEVERFVLKNSDHPKAKIIFSDLANSFFQKGDYKSAKEYYEKALINRADNLDTYELRYKLGLSLYNLKDYKGALSEFNYVKGTVAPNALNAAYYAAVINFQNENFDEALSDLKRVENVNPYKIEVPNWIAQILYRQKKYDELLSYAEPIIANPNGRKIDDICLVAAEVHFFNDHFDRAAVYYEKFKELRRGTVSPQVTFRHGYSLYKVENYAKAVTVFKGIASLNDAIGQQAAYYLGISALKSGDLNSAAAAFDAARKMKFDTQIKEEASYNFVKVLVEQNNNQQAVAELQAYLTEYPNGKYVDQSNELLSEILFETNNYNSAITYIEGLKKRTPAINEAYQKLCFNQGVVDFNLEKFDRAIQFFDKSLKYPSNASLALEAKYWKAESSFELNRPETESLYRELLSASDSKIRLKSIYSLGYLFYNQKNYSKALTFFEDFVAKTKNETALRQNYEDALLRAADCHLSAKNYNEALKYYESAIVSNTTDKDYALYQKGITLRFMGRDDEAKRTLDQFSKTYENSRLIDDALYQNGMIEMEKSNYQGAVALFTDLLRKKPNSLLVPNTLMKRGLAFSNLKNYDKAISDYKVIINKFGKSEAAEEALIGLRDVLNLVNRSEEFFEVAEQFKKSNPESGSIVNIQYESAKNLYYAEKYDKAAAALVSYIHTYPTSSNVPEAKFLIAESNYILKNKAEALRYYREIIEDNQTAYLTKSASRTAAIHFEDRNYTQAIPNYLTVAGSSSNKREIVAAWEGLFKSYYFSGNYDKAIQYCREALANGGNIVIGTENRAQLYLAKSYMGKADFVTAVKEFEKTISMAKDVNGAEAKYYIGEIQYKAKQYDTSIKTLQELAQDFADFAYWYEKAFLLISDNYIGKNDAFMAKATLKSIIDNSENKQTVEEAKQKLKLIN